MGKSSIMHWPREQADAEAPKHDLSKHVVCVTYRSFHTPAFTFFPSWRVAFCRPSNGRSRGFGTLEPSRAHEPSHDHTLPLRWNSATPLLHWIKNLGK